MKDLGQRTSRSQRWATLAVGLLITLGVAVAFSAGAKGSWPVWDASGGPWQNFTYDGCPPDMICGEWPQPGLGNSVVCCIPEHAQGQYDHTYCQDYLFIRPLR